MVLVAGLDRLKGTRVGPWLTDAEWQDHTREVRARFEARSDTSVAFQDFCREYAEGRVTTAAMRRARAPKGRDTAPLFTETIRAPGGATIYVDLKEGNRGTTSCANTARPLARSRLWSSSCEDIRERYPRARRSSNSTQQLLRPPQSKTSMAPSWTGADSTCAPTSRDDEGGLITSLLLHRRSVVRRPVVVRERELHIAVL